MASARAHHERSSPGPGLLSASGAGNDPCQRLRRSTFSSPTWRHHGDPSWPALIQHGEPMTVGHPCGSATVSGRRAQSEPAAQQGHYLGLGALPYSSFLDTLAGGEAGPPVTVPGSHCRLSGRPSIGSRLCLVLNLALVQGYGVALPGYRVMSLELNVGSVETSGQCRHLGQGVERQHQNR